MMLSVLGALWHFEVAWSDWKLIGELVLKGIASLFVRKLLDIINFSITFFFLFNHYNIINEIYNIFDYMDLLVGCPLNYLANWSFRRPIEEILKLLPGPHSETKRVSKVFPFSCFLLFCSFLTQLDSSFSVLWHGHYFNILSLCIISTEWVC